MDNVTIKKTDAGDTIIRYELSDSPWVAVEMSARESCADVRASKCDGFFMLSVSSFSAADVVAAVEWLCSQEGRARLAEFAEAPIVEPSEVTP